MNERERIAMLARTLPLGAARVAGVVLGIGDDAAVLEPTAAGAVGSARMVWTIDEQVEGTHFLRKLASWDDIGWRSFMAAVSDIPAMGARPWCALSALALPADVDDLALEAIARGQREAADAAGAPIVGGNLSRSSVLSITTTVLGVCARAVTRAGAIDGDGIWLAGRVGLAAGGFRALQEGRGADPQVAEGVLAWRRPRAMLASGVAMGPIAHAAIDVSDGLACDVGHLAQTASLAAVIEARALLEDEGLRSLAAALAVDPLELALNGGEDYALVAASQAALHGFRRIGTFQKGAGVLLRDEQGERAVDPRGFDHFRTNKPPEASRS